MPRSLILSGGGAYGDPWHPFEATSERLAALLAALEHDVEISEHVAANVADLAGWDLVVVNAAAGPEAPARVTKAAQAGLAAALDRGVGVLAIHVGVCTLLRLPTWESVTGASWVTGRSLHEKAGPARIIVYPERHPVCADIAAFDIVDERYANLRIASDVVPLAAHEHAGGFHPLLWARGLGRSRVFVDALGHDVRSYDAPAHRELISRAARWLTQTL